MSYTVIQIPALQDNYQHLLVCNATGEALVVDPADAASIMRVVKKEGANLVGILNTHHHWDHTMGNDELVSRLDIPVYAHPRDGDKIATFNQPVVEGGVVRFGKNSVMKVMEIPGHTLGQVAFYDEVNIFSGDTLFVAGCGRLFEGTPEQMYHSLSRIACLNPETRIFGGHEYALQNLGFALTLEQQNKDLNLKWEECRRIREKGLSTVPTTIREELSYNPFLRPHSDELRQSLRRLGFEADGSDADIFAATRKYKDSYK